jgi:predicted O-methyltransferase YrrM
MYKNNVQGNMQTLSGQFRCGCSYIKHAFTSNPTVGHGIHSPFMYALFTKCFHEKKIPETLIHEKNFKKDFLKNIRNNTPVLPGAGSRISYRKLRNTVSSSASPNRDVWALCRMVKFLKPKLIYELGTSAGLTTRALALSASETQIHTIEGNPEIAKLAQSHLSNFSNITIHTGLFDTVLPGITFEPNVPFFAFIDGNHSYDATLRYFNFFREHACPGSFIVIHDIRWSEGMLQAWNEITRQSFQGVSLESFRMGMVFFREGIIQQHFSIRY